MDFLGAHILSVDQFTLEDIERIFSIARTMEPYAVGKKRTRVLEGAIMANLFFEPSTRSRVSFGAAFNRLGGHVRDTTGIESSSIVKGESLWDTARVMSGYVDTIVVRHPHVGAVAEFSRGSLVPVISGGDGAGEHPTQALLDLYTIHKELGRELRALGGLHIAIVGDLKNGRAVHSLVKILALLPPLRLTYVSPPALRLPPELLESTARTGHIVSEEHSVESGIAGADVVYVTRLQRERFASPEQAAVHVGSYRVDARVWRSHCRPSTIIMHPLPRDSRPEAGELDNDLNDEPGLAIFRQTRNGVPIRMALFALALGVEKSVRDFEEKVQWRRPSCSSD